jgi:hypothetical protein
MKPERYKEEKEELRHNYEMRKGRMWNRKREAAFRAGRNYPKRE